MRTMKLERVSDGLLISDMVEVAKRAPTFQLNSFPLDNGRTYTQPWGGMEWDFDITLVFSSVTPTSSMPKMEQLARSIHRKDRLRFTFRDGNSYPVEVTAWEVEKDEDDRVEEVYHVDMLLVRKDDAGWIAT